MPDVAQPVAPARVARVATSISLSLILRGQLEALRGQGFDVRCVCDSDEWAERLRRAGFVVWPIGMGRRPGPARAALWGVRFYRALRREPVDIVHTHNAFHGIVGRVVARLAGVPVVVQTVHNWYYLDPAGGFGARVYLQLERLAGRLSDAVLFINRDDFNRAAVDAIVPAERRHFIGNGIDMSRFLEAWEAADRDKLRAELGLAPESVAVTMVARLEPPKDHDLFMSAFDEVRRRVPRAHALLVGYGLEEDRIRGLVTARGLDEAVSFLGYREDIPAVLKASDMLVLASRQEGFGRCLVEGMAASLPVVATDVVGARDVIDHGRTGLLVPPHHPHALARAMIRLIEDEALARALVSRASDEVARRFDERVAAGRVIEVYGHLLRAKRAARRGAPRTQ